MYCFCRSFCDGIRVVSVCTSPCKNDDNKRPFSCGKIYSFAVQKGWSNNSKVDFIKTFVNVLFQRSEATLAVLQQCTIQSCQIQSIDCQDDESKRKTENRLCDILLSALICQTCERSVCTWLFRSSEQKRKKRCNIRIPYKCIYTMYK